MSEVFRLFSDGTVAWFIEAAGGGAMHDINSDRNRPAKDPESWFGNIKYHSSLDLFEVAASGSVVVSHASVAAASAPSGTAQGSVAFDWPTSTTDRLLYTHGLGYLPLALIAVDDQILYPGMQVQNNANGGGRYVSAYVSATELRIEERFSAGTSTLSAIDLTYKYLISRAPPAPSGDKAFNFNATTGNATMGLERFDLERAYLQVVPGGAPLALPYQRMVDLKNGGVRMVLPDGTYKEPVPSMYTVFSPNYGAGSPTNMGYSGSFTGGDVVQVQAP